MQTHAVIKEWTSHAHAFMPIEDFPRASAPCEAYIRTVSSGMQVWARLTWMKLVAPCLLLWTCPRIECADSFPPGATTHDAPAETQSAPVDQEVGEVHTASMVALDGTTIDMVINTEGQAIAVATDGPDKKRKHKHHHHADEGGDSPADEQLNAGLINEDSPATVEDSMPQVIQRSRHIDCTAANLMSVSS